MKKLLVLMTEAGQFGNRLQSAAYFLATCYENNARAKLLCFSGFDDSLNITKTNLFGRLSLRIWRKVVRRIIGSPKLKKLLRCEVLHGTRENHVRLSSTEVQETIQRSRIVIITGYYIYCQPSILQKHAEAIRSRLAMRVLDTDRSHVKKITDVKNAKLVGIHIRHGDYREYRGGEHFFEHLHYEKVARSLVRNTAENLSFVICSDEPVPDTAFAGLQWSRGPGSLAGDMYALSQCDYVMGPFSTFNRWAAFWGDIPRFEVTKNDVDIKLSDFKPQLDLTQGLSLVYGKSCII